MNTLTGLVREREVAMSAKLRTDHTTKEHSRTEETTNRKHNIQHEGSMEETTHNTEETTHNKGKTTNTWETT